MTVLREVLARFGIDVDAGPLDALDQGIGGAVGQLKKLGAALAGGFAINALKNFVMQMVNVGDEISATSNRLGISTQALQEWRFAGEMADVEASEMTTTLRILQRTAVDAAEGGKESAKAFRELGVSVKDAHGDVRSIESLLPDLADGFARMDNPTEQTALALKIFGRSGQALLPLLKKGSAGIAELRAEFRRLGGGGSAEFLRLAGEMDDEMHRLDLAMFGLKARIATVLLPAFIRLAEATTKVLSALVKMAKDSHVVQAALLVLGAAAILFGIKFLAGFAGPIAIAAVVAIAIAFLILLVDDLITLFSGGKSVIGGFIDELFGAGTAAELVYELTEAWRGLVLTVQDATDAVKRFFGEDVAPRTGANDLRGGRADNSAAGLAAQRERIAREQSRRGVVVRNPGETMEAAQARFDRHQAEFRAEAEAQRAAATPARGRGRGRRAAAPRTRGGGGASVVQTTTNQINVPPGTPRQQVEMMRRAVGQIMDERNRSAAAALTQEAVED